MKGVTPSIPRKTNIQVGRQRSDAVIQKAPPPPPPSTPVVAKDVSVKESDKESKVDLKRQDVIGTDKTAADPKVAVDSKLAPIKVQPGVVQQASTPVQSKTTAPTPKASLPEVKFDGRDAPRIQGVADQVFGTAEGRKDMGHNEDLIKKQMETGKAMRMEVGTQDGPMRGHFYSADGHNLKDHNFKPDLSKPVVLMLSGSNGAAQKYTPQMAEYYQSKGCSVMSVNYRGFGNSDGNKVSEKGLYQDGQAMANKLVEMGYKPDQIIVHGYSLGGAVAAKLEQKNEENGVKFKGFVYDRPMTSAYEAAKGVTGSKVMAEGAKFATGSLSAKKSLEKTDKAAPKVLISDTDFLGQSGDALRTKLQKEGHNVQGKCSQSGHEDHASALGMNDQFISKLITG